MQPWASSTAELDEREAKVIGISEIVVILLIAAAVLLVSSGIKTEK